jgi:hypothetical protein
MATMGTPPASPVAHCPTCGHASDLSALKRAKTYGAAGAVGGAAGGAKVGASVGAGFGIAGGGVAAAATVPLGVLLGALGGLIGAGSASLAYRRLAKVECGNPDCGQTFRVRAV